MKKHNVKIDKLPLIIVAIAASIIVSGGGHFYIRNVKQSIRVEKHNELRAIAQLKVNQIVNWHNERLSEAKFFTLDEPYKTYIEGIINGNSEYSNLLEVPLKHILTTKKYENIFILDRKGKLYFSIDKNFNAVDEIIIKQATKVYKEKKIILSDFYYCPTQGAVHYDVIAPVLNDDRTIAVMVFRINPTDFLYPMIQDWPTPSKTAETLLVRQEGDSVVFLNQLRHYSNKGLSFTIPVTESNIPAVKAVLGNQGIFDGIDYRGHKVLSDLSKVPETSWYLIAKVDQSEIYAVLYKQVGFITVIVFIIILLVIVFVTWLYYYRQRNIYRQLFESEVELHQSQEEFRATLYSIGDGVITTDRNGIVKQLNPIAERLTGWKEKDAKGKKLEDVFFIVNEETRSKVQNPVSKVLKEGLIVGLANHTILISKEGKEIPITDSGAPIRNKNNEITGVVMVFRDQIEERLKQKELQESEAKFRSLIESAPVGIVIANNQQQTLTVNKKFTELTGYNAEVIPTVEEWWLKAYPDEEYRVSVKKKWTGLLNDAIKLNSEVAPVETRVTCNDGSIKFIEISFVNVGNFNIVTFVDITERKKVELELQKSKEFVLSIIENIPIGLAVNTVNPEVNFEFMNENFIKFYGVSKEKLMDPDTFWNAVYEDEVYRSEIKSRVLSDIASGNPEKMVWIDIPIKRSGKIVRYISARNIPLEEKGLMISTVWDVTERKFSEDQVSRLNKQLHLLIKALNKLTTVQSIEEIEHIVSSSSRELVNSDGSAFILKDGDKCHYVSEDAISFLWKGKKFPLSKCISGWVILNKQTVVIPDIYEDDRIPIELYNTTFVKSLVMVPLVTTQTFGAIGNFWAHKHYPTEEEIKLIETLADAAARVYDNLKLYQDLEYRVKEKTSELQLRISELERFHEATIDRETRMKELRDEIKRLKGEV